MVAVKFHGYSDEADRLGDAFFTKYDINKDQGLDKSEYEAVNAQFPSQVRNTPGLPTDNQMRRWSSFDRADTNRDGLVDRVEMGNMVYGVQTWSKWLFVAAVVVMIMFVVAVVFMLKRWKGKKGDSGGSDSGGSRASSVASSEPSSSGSSRRAPPLPPRWVLRTRDRWDCRQ